MRVDHVELQPIPLRHRHGPARGGVQQRGCDRHAVSRDDRVTGVQNPQPVPHFNMRSQDV